MGEQCTLTLKELVNLNEFSFMTEKTFNKQNLYFHETENGKLKRGSMRGWAPLLDLSLSGRKVVAFTNPTSYYRNDTLPDSGARTAGVMLVVIVGCLYLRWQLILLHYLAGQQATWYPYLLLA